jgi:hypothetical protein
MTNTMLTTVAVMKPDSSPSVWDMSKNSLDASSELWRSRAYELIPSAADAHGGAGYSLRLRLP